MIAHSGPQNPGTLFPVWCSLATRDPGTSLLIQAIHDISPLSFRSNDRTNSRSIRYLPSAYTLAGRSNKPESTFWAQIDILE